MSKENKAEAINRYCRYGCNNCPAGACPVLQEFKVRESKYSESDSAPRDEGESNKEP